MIAARRAERIDVAQTQLAIGQTGGRAGLAPDGGLTCVNAPGQPCHKV